MTAAESVVPLGRGAKEISEGIRFKRRCKNRATGIILGEGGFASCLHAGKAESRKEAVTGVLQTSTDFRRG